MTVKLPPGQTELTSLPRFGLTHFAKRIPEDRQEPRITIKGLVSGNIEIAEEIDTLPRVEQTSDFHCVTTWSCRTLRWSGYRFSDVYQQLILPHTQPHSSDSILILRGQDGARTTLLLSDALQENVLLADHLNGSTLSRAHGGPLRIVAPSHYGYKSVKYLSSIQFCNDYRHFRPSAFRFMDHPRARVHLEERGQWVPGLVLRYLYRPLVRPTIRYFDRTYQAHIRTHGHDNQ